MIITGNKAYLLEILAPKETYNLIRPIKVLKTSTEAIEAYRKFKK